MKHRSNLSPILALVVLGALYGAGCGGSSANPQADLGPAGDQGMAPDQGMCAADTEVCTDDDDCCSGNCDGDVCAEAVACRPLDAPCTANAECCTDHCNTDSGICVGPADACDALGDSCSFDWQCCTGNCGGGRCVQPTNMCESIDMSCTVNTDCCTGVCTGGQQCGIVFLLLTANGGACEHGGTCASRNCQQGQCVPNSESCEPVGADCTAETDHLCCSGICSEVGTCGPIQCSEPAVECTHHWECCSGTCSPYTGACEASPPLIF